MAMKSAKERCWYPSQSKDWGQSSETWKIGASAMKSLRQQGVNPEVLRVMKTLLDPKRVPEVKALTQARNDLYTYFRENTLVWSDKGVRALPSTKYFELTGGVSATQGCAGGRLRGGDLPLAGA